MIAASKAHETSNTVEKQHTMKDPFKDPWAFLEAGKNLATAAVLFAAAGPPYLVLKGLLTYIEPPSTSNSTVVSDAFAQGTEEKAELPAHALVAGTAGNTDEVIEVPADAIAEKESAPTDEEAFQCSNTDVPAPSTFTGSIVTAKQKPTAPQQSSVTAESQSAASSSSAEDGPDTPPLNSPRPVRGATAQHLPAASVPKHKKNDGGKAKHLMRPVAGHTGGARGSKKEVDPLKLSRKLYKSLKSGQVALQRKDYTTAMHHATKALEINADNLDAANFRVTVLVAQRKAEAGRASKK